MSIHFHYDVEKFRIKNSGELKKVIYRVALDFNKKVKSIDYIFTTEENILAINREFLNHDYFTDIITFDYSDGDSVSGEIYISVPTVIENALIFGKELKNETSRVIIHGVLHLCGFKDHTEAEQKLMRSMEDKYLSFL